MKDLNLYQAYLAMTALDKACDRAGVEMFGIDLAGGRVSRAWGDVRNVESAVSKYAGHEFEWRDSEEAVGIGRTTANIRSLSREWNDRSDEGRENNRDLFEKFRSEIKVDTVVIYDLDPYGKTKYVAGVIHGMTFIINFGVMPVGSE